MNLESWGLWRLQSDLFTYRPREEKWPIQGHTGCVSPAAATWASLVTEEEQARELLVKSIWCERDLGSSL